MSSFEEARNIIKYRKSTPQIISEEIENMIRQGKFPKGTKLSSEANLAKEFNVSRNALREALNILSINGYVSRQHGVGTFVIATEPVLQAGIEKLESITDFINSAGYKAGTKEIKISKELVSEKVRNALGIEAEQECVRIHRIRTADDKPVILADAVLNPYFFSETEEVDIKESLFEYIERRALELSLPLKISNSVCYIKTQNADAKVCGELECEHGVSLLVLEQIYYNYQNQPIFYSESLFNDKFMSFKVIRKRQ